VEDNAPAPLLSPEEPTAVAELEPAAAPPKKKKKFGFFKFGKKKK